MSRWQLAVAGVGLAATLVGGAYQLGRTAGAAEGIRTVRERVTDTLVVERTRYQRDTVRLWRQVTRWDTVTRLLEATPQRITDTVWVREALTAADATIRQCVATVRQCEEVARLEATRADLAETEARLLRRRVDDKRRPLLQAAGALGAGFVLGRLAR